MKALSRKRRKGGRPKRQDVDRTPSGQISRAGDAKVLTHMEMEAATWKRRQRIAKDGSVFTDPHLTPAEARKQEHGSVIARWLLDSELFVKMHGHKKPNPNEFTRLQHDTAQRFAKLHACYMSAIDAKRMRSSSEFGGVGGHPPDPFIAELARRDRQTIDAFKAARRAILSCKSPVAMMAIETIVIENQPADSLRGDLRMALNALAAMLKLQNAA